MADTPKPTGKQSNLVLVAALAANLGIAVAKFIAAGISGSSSMLTEGVHSVVDSGNQMLLLYGKHRAQTPADHDHPFGSGPSLYCGPVVVPLLILHVGAGGKTYNGRLQTHAPEGS